MNTLRTVSNDGGLSTPAGFHYQDDFIDASEEAALLAAIEQITFSDFELRGVVARRRVAFFGKSYGRGVTTVPDMPEFLKPLRARIAMWASVDADEFSMALINDYPPGAPIGWHRDAPQYAIVAGVSLLSPCRMRFRPYVRATAQMPKRRMSHEIVLAQRSAYLLIGEARSGCEHHIPAVDRHRYSVTFRTERQLARERD